MARSFPAATEVSIGELAASCGVTTSTLRFYERRGLILSRRTSGNQRRYSRDTLRRVAFIRASQRVGMPLAVIRDVLSLMHDEDTPTREDWARASGCWRNEVDLRIRQLERLRDNITDCMGCGCLSLNQCVLLAPRDGDGVPANGTSNAPEVGEAGELSIE